jgi:hypothetical protein
MVRACFALILAVLIVGCGDDSPSPRPAAAASSATPAAGCVLSRVRYDAYPGTGKGLSGIPWVQGEPASSGLVALLWYWPPEWTKAGVRRARIYTRGKAPQGWNVKVMWVWVGDAARSRGGSTLVVRGRRLNGRGSFRQSFGSIGYAGQDGAPSFASIIEVPRPGCWRLSLSTEGLRGTVTMRAVRG